MTDGSSKLSMSAIAALGLTGTAAYMWGKSDPEGYTFDPSYLAVQSYKHPAIPACRVSKYPDISAGNTTATAYDSFMAGVKQYGDRPCFGRRSSSQTDFDVWLTYTEVLERVTNIGYGLRWLGQEPRNDTFIGMFSKNRPEMVMTQLACYQHSMVIVPMYDTLGEEAMKHIVNQSKMKLVFCDDETKVQNLLKWGRYELPDVTTIVHMGPVSKETVSAVKEQGWTIHSFSDVEIKGQRNPVELVLCKPEHTCVVCYTSGTTGRPKGAVIEHNALYRTAQTCLLVSTLPLGENFLHDEVYLSYLPFAHMYEQIEMVEMLSIGAKIGFYSGDVTELLNDIRLLSPTIFATVPRLLTKIYDSVMNAVNQSAVKRWLFNKALAEKEKLYRRGIITKATVWDKLIFKKIQDTLGGRIKLMITASAPISPPVLRFLRLALGAVVFEGYGQTESTAGMSLNLVGEYQTGEVGPPLPMNTVKLVDVPEMNYYAADNAGEVCCYGSNVFKGYLYDEERTREAIDSEGWLHTGDIGVWTERGTLKIIDRKKNIFKLSQGEYIAPERLENVYVNCPLVAQCFVHGDSLQSSLVAVVVPDVDVLPSFAKSNLGIDSNDLVELCRNPKVKAAILEGMLSAAKLFKLKGFEQVRDIHLTAEPFSVENDLLTPTFKLKRIASRNRYQQVIEEMYGNLEHSANTPRSLL